MSYRTWFDMGKLVSTDFINNARKYTPQNYAADWSASNAVLINGVLANDSNMDILADRYPASLLEERCAYIVFHT